VRKKQIIAIISIELLVLTIVALLVIPKTSLRTKVDAINMNLTNYKYDYYVGTNVVKTGDIGTAKYTFSGIPAYYDLIVGYVDEDDGNCTYSVNINSTEVAFWTADKNPKKDCLFTKTIEDVRLSDKAEITILGTRNKGESARLAYIEIEYSHGMNPISLAKFGFTNFAHFIYTTNFFILMATLLVFIVLNITVLTIFRPKKNRLVSKEPVESNKSVMPDNSNTSGESVELLAVPAITLQNDANIASISNTVQEPVQNNSLNIAESQNEIPLIEQMTKYIDNNYTDSNFSVQQMADHFNLSLNYLSSFFKEQTGQNIVYYLTNLRVEKAKSLLSSSVLPVKDVAESSGYYNVSSFIRRFKQITGFTPGEYRLNNNSGQN